MNKFLLFFVVVGVLSAQIFDPLQDAYVYQYQPSTNFGTDGILLVMSNLFNYNSIARSLLEFDVSSIAPGTAVQSGILHVYMHNQAGSDFVVEVHRVLNNWDELTVNWNNQPNFHSSIEAALPYQGYTWWNFDITTLVQGWVDGPGTNQGLLLKFEIEQYLDSLGRVANFYSSDTTFNQPHLEVNLAGIEDFASSDLGTISVLPNPTKNELSLNCILIKPGQLRIKAFDRCGRELMNIANDWFEPGTHKFLVNCTGLASGVYFLRIEQNQTYVTEAFVVVE